MTDVSTPIAILTRRPSCKTHRNYAAVGLHSSRDEPAAQAPNRQPGPARQGDVALDALARCRRAFEELLLALQPAH
jgi:hypothetical protein